MTGPLSWLRTIAFRFVVRGLYSRDIRTRCDVLFITFIYP
jgi:hypothetical protein